MRCRGLRGAALPLQNGVSKELPGAAWITRFGRHMAKLWPWECHGGESTWAHSHKGVGWSMWGVPKPHGSVWGCSL